MKKRIVSNTGPLIAFAGIDRLDILKLLFEQVIVPAPVNAEILAGGHRFTGLSPYIQAKWIEVRQPSLSIDPLLDSVLDRGEASVIQLAREIGSDLVLIDERKGRKIARDIFRLHVAGTARILVEAKQKGMLANVRDAINHIRTNGYWLHDRIVNFALEKAGEL